jgi:parallel beta-helix repeat protein
MKKGARVTGIAVLLLLGATLGAAADLVDHGPIQIKSDYEFTAKNGVVRGSGTVDDPYVIEGWQIDAGYDEYGIRIHRTTRSFVIRNVEISGAAKAGIFLSYVKNGVIEQSTLAGNWVGIALNFSSFDRITGCTLSCNTDGIHFYFSENNQILSNVLDRNDTAIYFDASNENEIIANTLAASHMAVFLDLGSERNLLYRNTFLNNLHNAHTVSPNLWDYSGKGNYWFDYVGIDANADGIGDSPYVLSSDGDQDNFPLLTTP